MQFGSAAYRGAIVIGVFGAVLAPSPVDAQWYIGNYLGANHTAQADVSISQPGTGTSLVFHDVHFEAKPFKSPQYYGVRIGRLLRGGRLGLEFEFLHAKVISRTDLNVHMTGMLDGAPIDRIQPMNDVVERYNMTHGLNFLLVNVVVRHPLGGSADHRPASIVLRAGAGSLRPGTDTSIRHVKFENYEFAGRGAQAAAGFDFRLRGRLSALVEYKYTYAKPRISIAGGKGQTTTRSQQVVFGFAIGFSR